MYIWGMLKNTQTGRFHPIAFRRAPMPGNSDGDGASQRYKSLGHHTLGFDDIEAAQASVVEAVAKEGGSDCGILWEWDGEVIPAMVQWFGERAAA